MKRREVIAIPVTIGTDYVVELKRRLADLAITNREICQEIDWQETAFSRLFRPLEDGSARKPGIDTAALIENAIKTIMARRRRLERKTLKRRQTG